MLKGVIGISFTALALVGCQSMKLSPEGVAIRTITPVVAQSCKHVGIANSFQPVIVGGMSAAQVDIRNKVASLGGNAMVITAQYVDPGQYPHGNISAEAYQCDFTAQQATPIVTGVGLILSDLSSDAKASLERNAGALVKTVVDDSPAWKANVIPNDVLIAVNGEQVKNGSHGNQLLNAAFGNPIPVQVEVIRKGGTRTISITK